MKSVNRQKPIDNILAAALVVIVLLRVLFLDIHDPAYALIYWLGYLLYYIAIIIFAIVLNKRDGVRSYHCVIEVDEDAMQTASPFTKWYAGAEWLFWIAFAAEWLHIWLFGGIVIEPEALSPYFGLWVLLTTTVSCIGFAKLSKKRKPGLVIAAKKAIGEAPSTADSEEERSANVVKIVLVVFYIGRYLLAFQSIFSK